MHKKLFWHISRKIGKILKFFEKGPFKALLNQKKIFSKRLLKMDSFPKKKIYLKKISVHPLGRILSYDIRIDGIPSILTDLRKEFNPKNYILNFPANLVHASDILLLLSAFIYNDTHILVFSRLGLNNFYPKITFEYFPTSFIIVWIPTT